jgi:non-lysosomal glucosylceramidase
MTRVTFTIKESIMNHIGDRISESTRERKCDDLAAAGDCGCRSCGTGHTVPRREFLKVAGVGMVGSLLGGQRKVMAGDFSTEDLRGGHLVPADKKLDPSWVRALFARGDKEVYRGKALDNIGMPCGGIGSGQLYLCGDGTLGSWQIFNHAESNWVDDTHATYEHRGFAKPVDQGFAVAMRFGDEEPQVRKLSRDGFSNISFNGQYPIGTVQYEDEDSPVRVTMEAFSPFIPLNAEDSSLPATLFHITVKNCSDRQLHASVLGWLENAVCHRTRGQSVGKRTTRILRENNHSLVLHSASEDEAALRNRPEPRPTVVFEDFEGGDYAGWTVEGKAFGTAPATGTLANQQPVSDFEGQGLVNSYLGGDGPKGKMTSRSFTINRRFINLKIGGGRHADKTCVSLVVNGKTIRSTWGGNTEQLRWVSWAVEPLEGSEARVEIIDDSSGGWGHVLVDHIEFSDKARSGGPVNLTEAADYGTMVLTCMPAEASPRDNASMADSGEDLVEEGERTIPLESKLVGRLRSTETTLAPGQQYSVSFVLAWHFPNAPQGNVYAVRFPNAEAVANYVLRDHDRLTSQTRQWRDTYYDSTIPYWLLDRLHSTVSTLATGTCQWWANGRFYAYEGVTCCAGTCTHVWNYAHAHARLFPAMTRTIRTMQDLCSRDEGGGFHPESGLVGFRGNDAYAADGQCGTILKALREHQMSSDDTFLRQNWPRIKKALEYSIDQDANSDGLIENTQHNTYDINYEGANTFVGSLYLAALRAGEEMAREVGDISFATRCREIFESGTRLTQERLWNGEYFIQDVNLEKYGKHQYAEGCLSDHLFGQGWACQLGLGDIYPNKMVRSALRAIWKYNWAPDVAPYNEVHKPFRWFITPGQAGLFTCTWPKSEYLPEGTVYKNEVWTGIEYQVAGHMIAESMVTEGLAICRAIHDRYQPELINPYNEVECGDHYARAMASWGVYLALSGFEYHGPKGHLGFAPKLTPDHFKTAFTAAEGWGTFEQTREGGGQTERISIVWGQLRLKSLSFVVPAAFQSVSVTVGGRKVAVTPQTVDEQTLITFERDIMLKENDTIEIQFG